MNDYEMNDLEIKNIFTYSGLSIPFFRIAGYVVSNIDKEEIKDLDDHQEYVYLQFKLIDKDAGTTSGKTNVGVAIKSKEFYKFEKDYHNWVNYYEGIVNNQSFFAGEKKHIEKLVKSIEDRSIETITKFYEGMISRQEGDSIQRLNNAIENLERINEENNKLLSLNKEISESYNKLKDVLELFTDNVDDIKNENDELKAINKVKGFID